MRLGQFVSLQRGHDLPQQERRHGPIPILGSFGITGYHDSAKTKGPGVTVGRSGASFGVVSYSPSDYWPLNTVLYVTDFHGNDERFAYYFLKSIDFSRFNSGSAQPSLNRNYINPLEVVVPPIDEQRAIARILGALDDKIELNRRMNETLEAIARAIFKSWFVDFNPARAKAEGRQPLGMDAETAALFPDSFQDSPLGKIPKGWRVGKLDETVEILGGGTPKTSTPEYWGGDIPWFSVVDAPPPSDVFVIDTEKKITEAGLENSSAKLLPVGTTIISARGTVGKVALLGRPMAMNQSCYGIRPKNHTEGNFAYFCLRDKLDELSQSTHGTVFDTITRDTFKIVDVVVPPDELTLKFDENVRPLLGRILCNLKESRTLADLRDALLPKLISGEILVAANRMAAL